MDEMKKLEKMLQPYIDEINNRLSKMNFKILELEKALRDALGKVEKKKDGPISIPAWEAYKKAFLARHRVEPVRNAKVNRQCADLVKRLGKDAAAVIEFYLTLNDPQFVRLNHPLGILLMNCESIHSMWQRGSMTTSSQARAAEKIRNNNDASAAYLEKKYGRK